MNRRRDWLQTEVVHFVIAAWLSIFNAAAVEAFLFGTRTNSNFARGSVVSRHWRV
jgi:hypothetical protein